MYFVLAIALLCGIFSGFQSMNNCKTSNKNYKEPKNLLDFIING